MLGKLVKHEWIATVRKYALFYLVLGAMTVFATVIHAIPVNNMLYTMGEVAFLILYVLTLCGIAFCSTGMAVVRFYKNMVSDEGYLTFTLPAKVEQLVFAKLLVAFLWQLITGFLIILSLLCVFVIGRIDWSALWGGFSSFVKETGGLLPVFCIMLLVSTGYKLLLYYLSIAVGQLFGRYKILASVIAYCAIGFGIELIVMIVILILFGTVGILEIGSYMNSLSGMTMFYVASIVWIILLGIVEYIVTCTLLKKKLNLN